MPIGEDNKGGEDRRNHERNALRRKTPQTVVAPNAPRPVSNQLPLYTIAHAWSRIWRDTGYHMYSLVIHPWIIVIKHIDTTYGRDSRRKLTGNLRLFSPRVYHH